MSARALALAAVLLIGCAASTAARATSLPPPTVLGSSPSASAPSSSIAPPLPTPSASPGEIRVPLDAGQSPMNADDEALIVSRRLADGRTTRIEAIELRGGAPRTVRDTVGASVQVTSIRDGVITLVETQDTAVPMQVRMLVLAGRWRDPASIVQLDDITLGLIGGDAWNPVPGPETNGFEVAWLHAAAGGGYELRVRESDGTVHAVYSSTRPFSFALSRGGDIAIGELASSLASGNVALRLYSAGTLRTLAERPAAQSGYVVWQSATIVWSKGLGLVTYITSAERIDPTTLARMTVTLPPGCSSWTGGTDAQLAFFCGDHVELVGTGPNRAGPPLPLLHARAILRTDPGPPPIGYVTPVVTADPRPGAGAKF